MDPVFVYHRQAAHLLQSAADQTVLCRRYQDANWYFAGANSGATGIAAAGSLRALSLGNRLFVLALKDGNLAASRYE